jgi:hypothetical protein
MAGMPMRSLVVFTLAAAGLGAPASTAAQPAPRALGFVQAGTGLVEIANLAAGLYLTPRLDFEGWAAWNGVFGGRLGGGFTYSFGHRDGQRPPRHALTVGERVMLATGAAFDSHGDDLSSYIAMPVGYAFTSQSGLQLRAALAPILSRERRDDGHRWGLGGPFVTLSLGHTF